MNRTTISQLLKDQNIDLDEAQEKALTDALLNSYHEALEAEKKLTQAEKDKAAEAQSALAELQKAYDGAAKNAENLDALKSEMEKLKSDSKANLAKIESDYQKRLLGSAVELALTKAGAKNNKAAAALLDTENLKLNDDGTVTGLTEMIEKVKGDEATSFLFNAPKEEPKYNYIPKGNAPEQKEDPTESLFNSTNHENSAQIFGWE